MISNFDELGNAFYRNNIPTPKIFKFNDDVTINRNLWNLSTYYAFNENTGTIAYDSSGNLNHGTITGATWNISSVNKTLVSGVDYTLNLATRVLTTTAYLYNYLYVDVTYQAAIESSANNLQNKFSEGVGEIGIKIPIIFTLLIVLVIMGLLYFLYKTFIEDHNLMGTGL